MRFCDAIHFIQFDAVNCHFASSAPTAAAAAAVHWIKIRKSEKHIWCERNENGLQSVERTRAELINFSKWKCDKWTDLFRSLFFSEFFLSSDHSVALCPTSNVRQVNECLKLNVIIANAKRYQFFFYAPNLSFELWIVFFCNFHFLLFADQFRHEFMIAKWITKSSERQRNISHFHFESKNRISLLLLFTIQLQCIVRIRFYICFCVMNSQRHCSKIIAICTQIQFKIVIFFCNSMYLSNQCSGSQYFD